MDADGSNPRQVTDERRGELRAVLPPRRQAHHLRDQPRRPEGPRFDLYLVDVDGDGARAGHDFATDDRDDFDGFPMFSPDGKRLVFAATATTPSRTRRTSSSPTGRTDSLRRSGDSAGVERPAVRRVAPRGAGLASLREQDRRPGGGVDDPERRTPTRQGGPQARLAARTDACAAGRSAVRRSPRRGRPSAPWRSRRAGSRAAGRSRRGAGRVGGGVPDDLGRARAPGPLRAPRPRHRARGPRAGPSRRVRRPAGARADLLRRGHGEAGPRLRLRRYASQRLDDAPRRPAQFLRRSPARRSTAARPSAAPRGSRRSTRRGPSSRVPPRTPPRAPPSTGQREVAQRVVEAPDAAGVERVASRTPFPAPGGARGARGFPCGRSGRRAGLSVRGDRRRARDEVLARVSSRRRRRRRTRRTTGRVRRERGPRAAVEVVPGRPGLEPSASLPSPRDRARAAIAPTAPPPNEWPTTPRRVGRALGAGPASRRLEAPRRGPPTSRRSA